MLSSYRAYGAPFDFAAQQNLKSRDPVFEPLSRLRMYASGHFMWSSSCASSPFYTSYKLRMNFAKGIRVFASNVFWYRSTISGNRFFSRTATTAQAKLVVTEGGNRLQAVWSSDSGATPSKYHAVWLPVPDLRNHLLMESHELDPHIKISEMELKGQKSVTRPWP